MKSPVVTAVPTMPLPEAADLMLRHGIRRLVIVDPLNPCKPVGVVTRDDLLEHCPRGANPFSPLRAEVAAKKAPIAISKIMSHPVLCINSHVPIEDAAMLMTENRVSTLPVLQGGVLAGIITETDIFKAFGALVGGKKSGVRVTFAMTKEEDILEFLVKLARHRKVQIASFLTFYHHGEKRGVVRLHGHPPPEIIDEIWNSGHQVISVLRDERAV